MTTLRTAAQQALEALYQAREFTELYDTEHAASVNEQCHDAIAALRAALAREQAVTDDMRSAVRWAPSSAYWSERLREFFGPDAREGIDALERRLAEPDLSRCPQCNGPADNGHDRSIPPSPYICTKCMAEPAQKPVTTLGYAARKIEELIAQRDALLETLKYIAKQFRQHGRQHWPEAVAARAAIAAVEGETSDQHHRSKSN